MWTVVQPVAATGQHAGVPALQLAFAQEERRFKSLARLKRRRWQIQRQQQHIRDLKRNPRAVFEDLAGTHNALPSVLGNPDRWLPFQQRLSAHQAAAACHVPEELQPPSFCQEASERLSGAAITVTEVLSALHTLHNGRASGMSGLPAEYFRHAVGWVPHNNATPGVRATHLLGPTLAALFSATFASGTIPDA